MDGGEKEPIFPTQTGAEKKYTFEPRYVDKKPYF
jgi:hypothetical protein